LGEVQLPKVPLSSLHSKLEFVSEEENANEADELPTVPEGPESIVESAAVVSTVHVYASGVASVLPPASVALTRKVCEPSERPERFLGEVQTLKALPSRLHSNVAPASSEEKAKVAEALFVRDAGFVSMVVFGAPVSTLQVRLAGVLSALPAASFARTEKV
jgi:hypothetical protein